MSENIEEVEMIDPEKETFKSTFLTQKSAIIESIRPGTALIKVPVDLLKLLKEWGPRCGYSVAPAAVTKTMSQSTMLELLGQKNKLSKVNNVVTTLYGMPDLRGDPSNYQYGDDTSDFDNGWYLWDYLMGGTVTRSQLSSARGMHDLTIMGKGDYLDLFPLFGTRPHEVHYSLFYSIQHYFLYNITYPVLAAFISKFYPAFEATERTEGSDSAPKKKFDPLNPDTWAVKLWEQVTTLTSLDPKFLVQYEREVMAEEWSFPEECWRKAHDLVGSFNIPLLDDQGNKFQQTYYIVYQGVVGTGDNEQCVLEPKFPIATNNADDILYKLLDALDKCWKSLDASRPVSFMKKKDYPVSPAYREIESFYAEKFKMQMMSFPLLQQTSVVPPYLPYFINVDKYVDVTDKWRLRLFDYRSASDKKDDYGNPDYDDTSLLLDMFTGAGYMMRKTHATAADMELYATYRNLGISFEEIMKYAFLLNPIYYGGTGMMTKELDQDYGDIFQLQVVTKYDQDGVKYEEECSETVLGLVAETFIDNALQGCWNKNEVNHFGIGKQPKTDYVITNTAYSVLLDSSGVIQRDDADENVINDLWPVELKDLISFKRNAFKSIVRQKFNPIIADNPKEKEAGPQPKNPTGLDSGSWKSAKPDDVAKYKSWLNDMVDWHKKAGKGEAASNYETTLKDISDYKPPEEEKVPEAKPPGATAPPKSIPKETPKAPPTPAAESSKSDGPPPEIVAKIEEEKEKKEEDKKIIKDD